MLMVSLIFGSSSTIRMFGPMRKLLPRQEILAAPRANRFRIRKQGNATTVFNKAHCACVRKAQSDVLGAAGAFAKILMLRPGPTAKLYVRAARTSRTETPGVRSIP